MDEETMQNPYMDNQLLLAQQEYNPMLNEQFESRFDPGGKDKRTIVTESNKEIQRLLLSYLQYVGEKRSEESESSSDLGAAKAFISFIKYTCIDIIRSKCVIRQSLQYMYEILESKPVDTELDEKGKKLWSNLKKTLDALNGANSEMMEVGQRVCIQSDHFYFYNVKSQDRTTIDFIIFSILDFY